MHRTTTERGYGNEHQKQRRALKPAVDAGSAYCTERVCLYRSRWIPPGAPWDLAHGNTRSEYRGPAHAKCNRSEGARRRNAGYRVRRQPKPALPVW